MQPSILPGYNNHVQEHRGPYLLADKKKSLLLELENFKKYFGLLPSQNHVDESAFLNGIRQTDSPKVVFDEIQKQLNRAKTVAIQHYDKTIMSFFVDQPEWVFHAIFSAPIIAATPEFIVAGIYEYMAKYDDTYDESIEHRKEARQWGFIAIGVMIGGYVLTCGVPAAVMAIKKCFSPLNRLNSDSVWYTHMATLRKSVYDALTPEKALDSVNEVRIALAEKDQPAFRY